jgi:O-antigen/teichoic acid export membrane protein
LCISLTIFISYGDLGFFGAGYKFAGESYAAGDRAEEIRMVGFVTAIIGLFGLIFSGAVLALSLNPGLIFHDLKGSLATSTASRLLVVLAVGSLNSIYQRILQVIFGIRIEDYLLRRLMVIGNLVAICSVFWFFRKGSQDIVGYYLTVQVTNILVSAIATITVRKRYGYRLREVLAAVRFDRRAFDKTKRLAFATLLGTVGWVAYYEMDSLFISTQIGVSSLAFYSVGWTLVSYVRSLMGTLFTPVQSRFNHFIGVADIDGLKRYYRNIVMTMTPIILISVMTVFLLIKPLIISWVGLTYAPSILIGQLLISMHLLACFSYPAGMLLVAHQRIRPMNIITAMNVIVFWVGVILTYRTLGIVSLALFKLVTALLADFYYIYVSFKFVESPISVVKEMFLPLLIPLGVLVTLLGLIRGVFPAVKSASVMAQVIGMGVGGVALALAMYIAFSKEYRTLIRNFIRSFRALSV